MEKEVVVITGSSGRIGTRLIEGLGEAYQTVGLDFVGITSHHPQLEFVFVDLSSDESVECAFNRIRYAYGNKIASIVHLAAFYSFAGTHLELYEKITVQGTRRLLDQAKKFEVEQFVFTSTMLVHEPSKRGVIQDEDSPISGKWHYPASKVRTEKLMHEQAGDVPTVILRIAGCYDNECNCVPISQHISRIYEKQLASYVFPGKTSHGVPFTHFDDLVDCILLLIQKRKEMPKDLTLLTCEEDSISYRDLQTAIGNLLYGKEKWPMWRIPKAVAKLGAWAQNKMPFGPKPFIKPWMVDLADDNYQFSMKRSREVIGWAPKHNVRSTLPLIVENMLQDPVVWYKRHNIPLPKKLNRRRKG